MNGCMNILGALRNGLRETKVAENYTYIAQLKEDI
jgi:hypothetical protein